MKNATLTILGLMFSISPALADDSPGAAGFAPANDTAQATVEALLSTAANGHPEVICSALPASYQQDVNDIVRTFGENMDPIVWKQALGVVERLQKIVDTQGKFIANVPAVAERNDSKVVEKTLPHVAKLLAALVKTADLKTLQTFDLNEFAHADGRELFKSLTAMAELSPDGGSLSQLSNATVETVSESGDTATLRISIPGQPEDKPRDWVRVEGRWIPAEMAESWKSGIEEAKSGLAELPTVSQQMAAQMPLLVGIANGILLPLESAESQQQFDQAIGQVLSGLPLGF